MCSSPGKITMQPVNRTEKKQQRRFPPDSMPPAERCRRQKPRSRQLPGIKSRRRHGIGPCIVDFYSPQLNLAIEAGGDTRFTDQATGYGISRQRYIEKFGIHVLRFTNDEVLNNPGGVLFMLTRYVGTITPLAPLNSSFIRGEA